MRLPGCVSDEPIIEMILNPVMLEISLRNVWSTEQKPMKEDQVLSSK